MRAALLVVALLVVIAVPAAGHLDHVTATPQVSPDGIVYVEKAFVAEPVWLVLHANDGGEKGASIGHTALDPEERMEDVPVEISPSVWADFDGPRTIQIDLYRDDGDGEFDADDDVSMAESGPFSTALVTVRPGDERAYVGVSSFDDQRTSGSIAVRRVVLPDDGYLAIHNVSRGSPAEIVGHAALSAGEHENVTIDLDDEFFEDRPFSFPLVATAYVDDGDGELDDAEPVRVGEETVGSRFQVVKADADGSSTRAESDLVVTATDSTAADEAPGEASQHATAVGIVAAVAIAGLLAFGWYRLRR